METSINPNIHESWDRIASDLQQEPYEYSTILTDGDLKTVLDIEIDPGGGFEGGYAFTTFTAKLNTDPGFKFGLHHQGFLDEIGKFFGMQDLQIGDAEFDPKVVVKASNPEKVKQILADEQVRNQLKKMEHFSFGIHGHIDGEDEEALRLELQVEEGITDVKELQQLYSLFSRVHQAIMRL